jgi:hypothetical protein
MSINQYFESISFCLNSIRIIDYSKIVEQAWGAAAKHSTRRTTSVKKCVDSI